MAKLSGSMQIKFMRDYVDGVNYDPKFESKLKKLLGVTDLSPFHGGKRSEIGKSKTSQAEVSIHEDGPLFGFSVVDAVSIASGIASLVSLWLQLRTPQPPAGNTAAQDHYLVITKGDNTFRGKPNKKRLKQIVELMAKIDS